MMQPYHFTKDIGVNFRLFYDKVLSCKGVICFDLEDSVYTEDLSQLAKLKENHRKLLIDTLLALSKDISLHHLGFRINAFDTPYYFDDLIAIGKLQKIHSLFLPKVETAQQIKRFLKDISDDVLEIIPIIETKKGFENLHEILSIPHFKFNRFAFGHCDFNLSNQYFPFFHHNSNTYWKWIENLVYHAKRTGKQLINSPVLDLQNTELFSKVLSQNKLHKSITGQITLCLDQTILCKNIEANSDVINMPYQESSLDKFELAINIIDSFNKYKIKDRHFAIDKDGRLISPQEYAMAKMVLKEIVV